MKEPTSINWEQLDLEVDEWSNSWNFVIHDMKERQNFGLQKYGKSLTVNTDEDMLQHLYEELLDGAVYIKTLINQRKLNEKNSCCGGTGSC